MKQFSKAVLGFGFVFLKTSDNNTVNLYLGFFKKTKPKDVKSFSITWVKDLTSKPKEIQIKSHI